MGNIHSSLAEVVVSIHHNRGEVRGSIYNSQEMQSGSFHVSQMIGNTQCTRTEMMGGTQCTQMEVKRVIHSTQAEVWLNTISAEIRDHSWTEVVDHLHEEQAQPDSEKHGLITLHSYPTSALDCYLYPPLHLWSTLYSPTQLMVQSMALWTSLETHPFISADRHQQTFPCCHHTTSPQKDRLPVETNIGACKGSQDSQRLWLQPTNRCGHSALSKAILQQDWKNTQNPGRLIFSRTTADLHPSSKEGPNRRGGDLIKGECQVTAILSPQTNSIGTTSQGGGKVKEKVKITLGRWPVLWFSPVHMVTWTAIMCGLFNNVNCL